MREMFVANCKFCMHESCNCWNVLRNSCGFAGVGFFPPLHSNFPSLGLFWCGNLIPRMFSTFALRSNFNVDTFRLVYCVQLTCLNRFILMFYCVLLVQRLILIALFCFHGQTPILNQILLDVLTFLMPVFNGDRTQPYNFRHMSHVHANAPEAFVGKGPTLQKMGEYERVQKYNPKNVAGNCSRGDVYTHDIDVAKYAAVELLPNCFVHGLSSWTWNLGTWLKLAGLGVQVASKQEGWRTPTTIHLLITNSRLYFMILDGSSCHGNLVHTRTDTMHVFC